MKIRPMLNKTAFFWYILICIRMPLLSQPVNDACEYATTLSADMNCLNLDFERANIDLPCNCSPSSVPCAQDVWYQKTIDTYSLVTINGDPIAIEILKGTCLSHTFAGCGSTLDPESPLFEIYLAPGQYIFALRVADHLTPTICIDIEACPATPQITQPADAASCGSYQLPPITGSNLTGNEAYFSEQNGMGIQYPAGSSIYHSGSYYVYVSYPCGWSQRQFEVAIDDTPGNYSSQINGYWNELIVWGLSPLIEIPGPCDDVSIPSHDCVISTSASCKTLDVELGGQLSVFNGATFEVLGESD